MLSPHQVIAKGLFNAEPRCLIISRSPPDTAGAVSRASHITGIIPITQRIRFYRFLSAVMSTLSSALFLVRGIYRAEQKSIYILGGALLFNLLTSQIVQSVYHHAMLKVVER